MERYLYRSIYIDVLKLVAILAVITIHISASSGAITAYSFGDRWWMANIFDSLSRWAVPVFIMCSGATLLNKNETIKDFFKKRASKILIPFIIWSIFYYFWKFNFDFSTIKLAGFIKAFIEGNVYIHLWYVYMIIGLYLVTPIFRLIIQSAKKTDLQYLLLVWFIILGVFPVINKFLNINISINIQIGWYAGYYFLGYYLNTYEIKKSLRYTSYILGILAFVITILGTYKLTIINKGISDYYFYNDSTFINILMTISIFLFIKNIKWVTIFDNIKILHSIVFYISNYSYGIYLGHFLIISILYKYLHISYDYVNVFVGIPLLSLTILISSFIMVHVYTVSKKTFLKFKHKIKHFINSKKYSKNQQVQI